MNKKGQSTIEFLTSFAFVISILFLYVKMALNITNGYLLHYATFVASRSYLVNDNLSDDPASTDTAAQSKAREVFSFYEKSFTDVKAGPTVQFNNPGMSDILSPFIGVWAEIKQVFSYSKMVGGGKLMNYRSESFLGREPVFSECLKQVCKAMEKAKAGTDCSVASTLVDNGC